MCAEIRTHGTGFYQFSKDSTLREEQMDMLKNLREQVMYISVTAFVIVRQCIYFSGTEQYSVIEDVAGHEGASFQVMI